MTYTVEEDVDKAILWSPTTSAGGRNGICLCRGVEVWGERVNTHTPIAELRMVTSKGVTMANTFVEIPRDAIPSIIARLWEVYTQGQA